MAEIDAERGDPFDRPDAVFNTLEGWTWIGSYSGYYLQCDQLAAFDHGFFTRLWQGRGPGILSGCLSAGVSVHRTRQVHGALVLPASAASTDPWPEADGLISDQGGQSLWVCGADCTPVLIADPINGRVASCHAGWRGVAAGILTTTVAALRPDPSQRKDLLVALGPAISGACYQVETSVALAVAKSLNDAACVEDQDLKRLSADGVLLADPEPDRLRLDIRQAARRQLIAAGISEATIDLCPLCTASEPELFHSWRRDQVKAVQWSGIVSQMEASADKFSENDKSST
jgi:YfiH family protein